MKLAIGSDSLGSGLKNTLIKEFCARGYAFEDFGVFPSASNDDIQQDYPDIAFKVAAAIAEGRFSRGVLICGTGIGMSISANKVKGVYAAVCHDIYSTERSILSNNVQILCMGALVIGPSTAIALLDRWLQLEFKPSPSLKKIKKIKDYEAGVEA